MRMDARRVGLARAVNCASTENSRVRLAGANEFAATTTRSPPAWTRRPGGVRRSHAWRSAAARFSREPRVRRRAEAQNAKVHLLTRRVCGVPAPAAAARVQPGPCACLGRMNSRQQLHENVLWWTRRAVVAVFQNALRIWRPPARPTPPSTRRVRLAERGEFAGAAARSPPAWTRRPACPRNHAPALRLGYRTLSRDAGERGYNRRIHPQERMPCRSRRAQSPPSSDSAARQFAAGPGSQGGAVAAAKRATAQSAKRWHCVSQRRLYSSWCSGLTSASTTSRVDVQERRKDAVCEAPDHVAARPEGGKAHRLDPSPSRSRCSVTAPGPRNSCSGIQTAASTSSLGTASRLRRHGKDEGAHHDAGRPRRLRPHRLHRPQQPSTRGHVDSHLFVRLARGGGGRAGVLRLLPAAGERHVAGPGVALALGAADEQQFRPLRSRPQQDGDGCARQPGVARRLRERARGQCVRQRGDRGVLRGHRSRVSRLVRGERRSGWPACPRRDGRLSHCVHFGNHSVHSAHSRPPHGHAPGRTRRTRPHCGAGGVHPLHPLRVVRRDVRGARLVQVREPAAHRGASRSAAR